MADLQIMAVSLESSKRYMAFALYDGERVAITHCKPLVGKPSKWGAELREKVKQASEEGWSVLVEDRTGVFATGDASIFSFEDVVEGRSMLFHSLDWYFSMQDLGQIIVDKSVEGFMVRSGGEGQKIERRQDDRGRTIYAVDWTSLHGAFKAILMCVSGAMMQPLSDRFLAEMYGNFLEAEDERPAYERSWDAITKGVTNSEIKKWDSFYKE